MDYKKAYKEALERAKELQHDNCWVTTIFPELRELEDEKIRKEIIEYLRLKYEDPNAIRHDYKKWIAWLEKQKTSEKALQYLKENHSPSEVSDFQAAMNIAVAKAYDKGYNDTLEKQGEQNSTDKVEPKFKVGDWIVDKFGLAQQVLDFRGGIYTCTYNSFTTDCESNYHLWTIKDAKNGDVLQLGKVTVIFKEFIGNNNCKCYCSVCNGEFETPSQNGADNSYGCHNATPATKEQRDLLFQKMKEAEYEWNDEKINSAWSEDDEEMWIDAIKYLELFDAQGIHGDVAVPCIKWLKSIKERVQLRWKPSDTQMKWFRDILSYHQFSTEGQKIMQSLYDDLKKLNEE